MVRISVLAIVAVSGLASSANAGITSVIFAENGPRAAVPGLPGRSFTAFDRPRRSLDGRNWIITALIDTGATTTDEVVITGSGFIGMTRAQEGVTEIEPGRTIDSGSIDAEARINDAGDYVFAGNLGGATTDDEAIIRGFSGGGFAVPFREGQNVGTLPTFTGDVALGTSQSSANIDNAGRVSFRSFSITGGGAGTGTNAVLLRQNASILDARLGVSEPTNVPGRQFDTLDTNGYATDASGNHWVTFASVTGDTTNDGVLVYNGAAVLQEGVTPIAGGTVGFITEWDMIPNGQWWSRGNTGTGNPDWVARGNTDGSWVTIAVTDGPITPGNTELWDDAIFTDTFFLFSGDNNGNYVLGGVTNAADVSRNAVLVYNGVTELLREGDAVDLDGNGTLDDNAFISVFNNDDSFLTDDGYFYFTADLVDGAGGALGQAFMAVQVPSPGTALLLGLGAVCLRRRR